MVVHALVHGQGGDVVQKSLHGGVVRDVGAAGAPGGGVLRVLGGENGDIAGSAVLSGGALDGDGLNDVLCQFRKFRQEHHVVDGGLHVGVQGVCDDIHRGLLVIHQHIVAVAVRGGVAQNQVQVFSLRRRGVQRSGGVVSKTVAFQGVAVGDGLLWFQGGQLAENGSDGGVVQGETGVIDPNPRSRLVQREGQRGAAVIVGQGGVFVGGGEKRVTGRLRTVHGRLPGLAVADA